MVLSKSLVVVKIGMIIQDRNNVIPDWLTLSDETA